MKILLSLVVLILSLSACKKNPEKAFLTGQLVSDCSGTPVANTDIYLYQDHIPAPNWAVSSTAEKMLESTTTDENGYFCFSGKGYTNDGTTSLPSTSIRLDYGTKLVVGTLGKGKGENAGDLSDLIQDVGMVYESSSTINFTVTADTLYDSQTIDSIRFTGINGELLALLTDKSTGKFTHTGSFGSTNHPIQYDLNEPDNLGKHQVFLQFQGYSGGQSVFYEPRFIYVSSCSTMETIHLEH